MSSGTYLGVKSEMDFEKAEGDLHSHEAAPLKQGLVAFLSFDLAGLVPLLPYIFGMRNSFYISVALVFAVLFLIGALRGKFTRKHWFKGGCEILLIGGMAAVVAYLTGYVIENFIIG
jgi:VIT1/CCC1 family predicted Fe2+/Mn2+ transporter